MSIKYINSIITIVVLFCSIVSNAENAPARKSQFLLKPRVGYLKVDEKLKSGDKATVATQEFSNGFMWELALSYFFTENIAIEGSSGYSSTKYTNLSKKKESMIGIPASILAQFYLPIHNIFIPYVGIGYQHMFFFNEPKGINIDSGGGLVLQTGFDWFVFEELIKDASLHNISLNVDIKYKLKSNNNIIENKERFSNEISNFSILSGLTIVF